MTRKEFIEMQGATCNNWTWSWSFVNHEHKFVIFGAWDRNVKGEDELILSENWQRSQHRRQAGYRQALEHIRLIEEDGYRLMTFPMEFSDEKRNEEGNGPATIKSFLPELHSRKLKKIGENWYALDTVNEEKIARICWNSKGWQKPSGREGKTNNKDAYEFQNGYGHEEWLLDISKVINGYHYAYVQAIGSHRDKYIGNIFDISFYSINSETRQRWWLGTIRKVHIVGKLESQKVFEIYKKKGWYDEMIRQLEPVGANVKAFHEFLTPETFAVIKFKIEDLELFDEPMEFSHDDPAVTSDYYNLKDKKLSPKLRVNSGHFEFIPGHREKKSRGKIKQRSYSSDEVDLVHNQIQTELFNYLVTIHGRDNVATETSTGNGTFIDAVVRDGNSYTLYEIKTSFSARQCIRDALGQLLEYAHFGTNLALKELVVVSPNKITDEASEYLGTLRKQYGLPIIYKQFISESSHLLK